MKREGSEPLHCAHLLALVAVAALAPLLLPNKIEVVVKVALLCSHTGSESESDESECMSAEGERVRVRRGRASE